MMYKILLDDRFYNNTLDQRRYFNGLLQVIKQYFDAKIVFFTPFTRPVLNHHKYTMGQTINKEILSTKKTVKYDLNLVDFKSDQFLEFDMKFSQLFVGKIEYILKQNPNDILIVPLIYSKKNRELLNKSYENKIFFIGNYDEEVDSNLVKWIQNNQLISVEKPDINNKFPAKDLCKGFDLWRSEILKPSYDGDKISDFDKIALEVACRNNYLYDSNLSAINKKYAPKDKDGNKPKRQVFKSKQKNKVYLSTDFENGGFEVFDKNARPKGQYRFNGEYEKDNDDGKHPFYLK